MKMKQIKINLVKSRLQMQFEEVKRTTYYNDTISTCRLLVIIEHNRDSSKFETSDIIE